MSTNRIYTDIIINKNSYSIVEYNRKPKGMSARETLARIEKVIQNNMDYSKAVNDGYSSVSKDQLYNVLRGKAEVIRDGFMKKSQSLFSIQRIFKRVAKKEAVVESSFKTIANLAKTAITNELVRRHIADKQARSPKPDELAEKALSNKPDEHAPEYLEPALDNLPNELIHQIYSYANNREMHRVALVNKHAAALVRDVQYFGYQGHDYSEAREYLQTQFQLLKTLVKDGHIPQEFVKKYWISSNTNSEATLRNIRQLTGEDAQKLKSSLSLALFSYINEAKFNFGPEIMEIFDFLFALGADPNITKSTDNDNDNKKKEFSSLVWAAELGNAEILKRFIEANADVNTLGWGGINAALSRAVVFKHFKAVEVLLKNGAAATINLIDENGNSLLHQAALESSPEIVKLLLDHGADVHLKNYNGEKPIEWAEGRKIRKILKKYQKL